MHDTYFNVPEAKADRLVNFYQEDSTGLKVQDKVFDILDMSYPLKKKEYFSGGGGLSSTIYDYAVFLQMLLNNGEYNGVRLLARNTVRIMTMNQINDLTLGDNKFGLGFMVVTEKGSAMQPHREGTYATSSRRNLFMGWCFLNYLLGRPSGKNGCSSLSANVGRP